MATFCPHSTEMSLTATQVSTGEGRQVRGDAPPSRTSLGKPTLKPTFKIPSPKESTVDFSQSSLSTLSSISTTTEERQNSTLDQSASPQAHLHKLKRIHRRAKRRKQWRRFRKMANFFIIKILVTVIIFSSIVLITCSYLLNARLLLAIGSICLIASIGCMVPICFSERSGPNKFNSASIPFYVPPEDLLDNQEQETAAKPTNGGCTEIIAAEPPKRDASVSSNTGQNFEISPPQTRTVSSPLDIHTRRMSLALSQLASNSMQPGGFYRPEKGAGVLGMARRLTLASSAMGMDHPGGSMYASNWATGPHICHGVRRSLAWNNTGASRFYEDTYD